MPETLSYKTYCITLLGSLPRLVGELSSPFLILCGLTLHMNEALYATVHTQRPHHVDTVITPDVK